MRKPNDLSRSLTVLKEDMTLIAVIEMSQSSWLIAGIVPGIERHPLKKLAVDESALLKLLNRWREQAEKAGHRIERIAIAFEAGRDGFWLARWLKARGIEAHIIHASSIAVSREHRRAKTDRLDTELLKRAFLGWLRGERDHCKMVAIPTLAQEDAKRPNRERESLVSEQSRIVNRMKAALARLGIRGFNPKLKTAVERLEGLCTPEDEPIPPNTLAELKRDMERCRLVRSQIRDIEKNRVERIDQGRATLGHARIRNINASQYLALRAGVWRRTDGYSRRVSKTDYESGGQEFESLRARQFSFQINDSRRRFRRALLSAANWSRICRIFRPSAPASRRRRKSRPDGSDVMGVTEPTICAEVSSLFGPLSKSHHPSRF